jgi:hypothetical protein
MDTSAPPWHGKLDDIGRLNEVPELRPDLILGTRKELVQEDHELVVLPASEHSL